MLEKHKCSAKKFECTFCKIKLSTERGLLAHNCKQKLRWEDRNTRHVRIGFMAYYEFYRQMYRQEKTIESFQTSSYYMDFVKFGRYIVDMNIPHIGFLNYVIKNSIPLNKWRLSETFQAYLYKKNSTERWEDGISRSVETMQSWGGDNWNKYFDLVTTNEAVNHMQRCKLSPWLFYGSDKAKQLIARMNEEQINMISDFLDPAVWKPKTKTKIFTEVCEFIGNIGL